MQISQCSTPFGITDPFAYGNWKGVDNYIECSTSFGITDPFARNLRRHWPFDPVLNAFRHH